MLQFIIAGLVLGSIYALAASGLVITYVSTGILNFAFGSLAFFIARLYYHLHVEKDWEILPAAVVCLLVVAPLLGLFLYVAIFRFLRLSSQLIKVVVTIGLSVTIPPIGNIIFGNVEIFLAPGLAPQPVDGLHGVRHRGHPRPGHHLRHRVIAHRGGRGAGPALHRGRPERAGDGRQRGDDVAVGQQPDPHRRRRVDGRRRSSPASPGILAAPIIGLDAGKFTLLIAAAFAAVIAARLRSLPIAVVVALLDGRRRQPRAVLPAARQRVPRQRRSRASRSRSS